jgi:hypothetical protein
MIRIIAYCCRWKSRRKGDITPMEKIEAEQALVYHSQHAPASATTTRAEKQSEEL